MTDLSSLISKLEGLEGPSREVDGALWLTLVDGSLAQCWGVKGMKYAGHVHTKAEKAARIKQMSEYSSPPYTASLDAAVALVEKMRPGQNMRIERQEGRWFVTLTDSRDHLWQPLMVPNSGANLAIALLIALLRSLSQEGGGG